MQKPDWKDMSRCMHEIQRFSRNMLAHQKKKTLNTSELSILSLLFVKNKMTPLNLSRDTGMKIESVSRTLKLLSEKKYVQMEKSKEDERIHLFSLTADGNAELNQNYEIMLSQLYYLERNMGNDFVLLAKLIAKANRLLQTRAEEEV